MKPARQRFRPLHRDDRLPAVREDSYRMPQKLAEGTACPDCGAVQAGGRWVWGRASGGAPGARRTRCPACRRLRDGMPAGWVQLEGAWFAAHRREVLARLEHCEAAERRQHPLQRIMRVEYGPAEALVTTTDVHLARRMGHALRAAFKGTLTVRYARAENQVRVRWMR